MRAKDQMEKSMQILTVKQTIQGSTEFGLSIFLNWD